MSGLRTLAPKLILGGLCGALAASAACTETEGGVSQDEAAEEVAAALCGAYFDCACDTVNDLFSSEEQCRAAQESDIQRGLDEGKEAGLTYQEDCVSKLLAFVSAIECGGAGSIDLELYADLIDLDGCKIFYGTRDGGQSCTPLSDADYGDDCDKNHLCEGGTCVEIDRLADPGDACSGFNEVCSGGAVCFDIDQDGSFFCEDLPGSGETCLGALDICDLGLTCDQSSKTCVTAPGQGQPCAPGNVCALGFACDMPMGNCIALPTGGEPCLMQSCAEGFSCQMGNCVEDDPLICGIVGTL